MSELFGQIPSSPVPDDPGTPSIPPPPKRESQVTIRTLASDLARMSGANEPISISVPVGRPEVHDSRFILWVWIGVAFLGGILLFFIGFYVLPLFLNKPAPAPQPNLPVLNESELPKSNPEINLIDHSSLFRTPPDETLQLVLGGDGPLTFAQQLDSALKEEASPSSSLVEVVVYDLLRQPLSWAGIAKMLNLTEPNESFWTQNFSPDPTIFVNKEETGYWLAYILKLKEGRAPVLLQNSLFSIEKNAERLEGLFLRDPGSAQGGFEAEQIAGRPARELIFSEPGADFLYGWIDNGYLILATSRDSFLEAGKRL